VGHIAKACKSKSTRQRTEPGQKAKQTHYVGDPLEQSKHTPSPSDMDNSYNLFTVAGNGQSPILLNVTVNQTLIQMEIDTAWCLIVLDQQANI